MSKKVRILHRIFIILSSAILFSALIFYLIRWSSLPEKAGVHFGPDCQFDVYGSKFYGFYPHIVGAVFTAGFGISGRLINKKKTGLSVDEIGERIIRSELCITIDIIMLFVACIFSYWSLCVSLQQPLNKIIAGNILFVLFGTALVGFIAETITFFRHRKKNDNKHSTSFHGAARIAAWMFAGISLILIVLVNISPPRDKYGNKLDQIYYENIDSSFGLWTLFIPFTVQIIILGILEFISVRAFKNQKIPLVVFSDSLKVICGIFFCWWTMLLSQEIKIGIVSVSLFAALCIMAAIRFMIQSSRRGWLTPVLSQHRAYRSVHGVSAVQRCAYALHLIFLTLSVLALFSVSNLPLWQATSFEQLLSSGIG